MNERRGSKRFNRQQPIVCIPLTRCGRQRRVGFFSLDGPVCMRHAIARWALIPIRVGILPYSLYATSHPFLATTLRSDHGNGTSTTEGEEQTRPLRAEHGHRWPEYREGSLEHDASRCCSWLRHHSSHHNQGMPSLRQNAPGSHTARTRWPTKRTTSSLGCFALISVKPLDGEWMERNRTTSANPSAMP